MSIADAAVNFFFFLVFLIFGCLIISIICTLIEKISKLLIKIYAQCRENRQIIPSSPVLPEENNVFKKRYIIIKNPYNHNLSIGTVSSNV